MKVVRVLVGGMLLLLAAAAAGFWYAELHQNQLVNLILAQVAKRTGWRIEPTSSRLGLGTRLVVVLEEPRVVIDGQETAQLAVIRVVFSYWALLHRTGLPLYALVLDRGIIHVPREPSAAPAPGSITSRLETLMHYLDLLSGLSRRFDLIDVALLGEDNRALAEHVNAVAYQPHYRGGPWPWIVQFNAQSSRGPSAGAQASGDLEVGVDREKPGAIADGTVWFWDLPLHQIKLADFSIAGRLQGEVTLAVSKDGQSSGNLALVARDLVVGGPALSKSLALGNFSSRGDYRISRSRAELSNFELLNEQAHVLKAHASLLNPYISSRTLTFSASGIAFELANTTKWVRSVRSVPPAMLHSLERIRSGTLMVRRLSLNSETSLKQLTVAKVAQQLQLNAELTGVSYVPPPGLGLPPVYEFNAQMNYSGGTARIKQASAQIGGSSFSDMSLDLDLTKAPGRIDYRLKLASWLDAADVYGATREILERAQPRLRGQVQWVYGHSSIQLQANGTIDKLAPAIPRAYRLTADLSDIQFKLNGAPSAIWLNGGGVVIDPGRISLKRVRAIPLGETGNGVVGGVIVFNATSVQFHEVSVELDQLPSADWVPLLVGPSETAVSGPIGGRLLANSKPGVTIPIITGQLALNNGTVQPGFLRSPIMVTRTATLTLDGRGLVLNIPGSRLEGAPLDFRMAIADFNHPQLRIDAKVARLDFEVMRFIRLPWSRSAPPEFFPVPVSGHIEAKEGNFDKLPMSDIAADFHHNSLSWRVDRFRATAFNGGIDLTISGRARDDWIGMKGAIAQIDAGPLFRLSGTKSEPPIIGKLSATGDLWADTNTDFFRTLAGSLSIMLTDGRLNRFTLLKRILSLVNLKNWLTAQFPDPRESGLPFKTLAADFRGIKGDFYTNNLRMNGPVMDITARGSVDIGNSTMNMEIAMLALQTVNWLINNIPIIGKHLSGGTEHLVGAYFQVHGRIDNPAIRPKPLTSVAEFVLKTLALPINIIAPDTIQ